MRSATGPLAAGDPGVGDLAQDPGVPAPAVAEVGVLLEQVLQRGGGVERAVPEPRRDVLADVGQDLLDGTDLADPAGPQQPVVVLAVAVRQLLVVQPGRVEGRTPHHQRRAVQLLDPVLQQPLVADDRLAGRPVDVAALAHEQADARSRRTAARGRTAAAPPGGGPWPGTRGRRRRSWRTKAPSRVEQPGVAGAAEAAGARVVDRADLAVRAGQLGEGRVDLLAVVDHDDLHAGRRSPGR